MSKSSSHERQDETQKCPSHVTPVWSRRIRRPRCPSISLHVHLNLPFVACTAARQRSELCEMLRSVRGKAARSVNMAGEMGASGGGARSARTLTPNRECNLNTHPNIYSSHARHCQRPLFFSRYHPPPQLLGEHPSLLDELTNPQLQSHDELFPSTAGSYEPR